MVIKKAIDVDDVLAGFYKAACDKFGIEPIVCDIWDAEGHCKFIVDRWDEIKNDFEFWENLPVLVEPESINFDFEYYVSSFPKVMYDARLNWLRKNNFPDRPLIHSTNKLDTCLELGVDVLIDDKESTIKSLHGSGVIGVWHRPYYMIDKGQHIDCLSQVNDYLLSAL